jgi:hypothetical protein
MTYAELIFELKRLADLAHTVDDDIANDLHDLLAVYDTPKGDCCG